ncbi:uncharacterized protein LOC131038649 isoform X1 [Cryptomeria japonica]|uniref:uncharacterized protein LOC131038649 isoform X1 n=1 Tax=Cryptomeria japonica TaxID=3369 RepID=UPI0027DA10F1|nr:uncharacterized protein LOC131038649 isoform X1 [Cryptomeria japonica]XP_057827124.2 uncharacterized protein LOC131038649 isoform X1 [Cryptomeria japonica]
MVLMDSLRFSKDTTSLNLAPILGGNRMSGELIGDGDSTLFLCNYYDLEQVKKLVQSLHLGLATACVANTMGDFFKTPATVAANLRKEMVIYLQQQSKAYAMEYVASSEFSSSRESPVEVVDDLIEKFVYSKRNIFTRVSGWFLGEQEEDKIDDFVYEMDKMGFWVKGQREVLAKELLKAIDLGNTYHCDMKFESREELELHKSVCVLRPLHCTNEGCREVFCAAYAKDHDTACPLKLVPCEQNCSKIVNRIEMDKHCITECPMRLVNCPFYQVGCISTIPQASIKEHCAEFLQSHLFYVLQFLRKQEASVGDLTQQVILLEKSLSHSQRLEAVDIGSLCLIIRGQEAKMQTVEQIDFRQDMKAAEVL